MLNPLRSEDEAFRFLLYAFVVIAVIVGSGTSFRHCDRALFYLTVSVPHIPAARWPGAWQKKV